MNEWQPYSRLILAVALLAAGPDGEWARFRGPNGSGVSESGALPTEFGPAKNVDLEDRSAARGIHPRSSSAIASI